MPYDLRRKRNRTMAVWVGGGKRGGGECRASGAVCETSESVKPAMGAKKATFSSSY